MPSDHAQSDHTQTNRGDAGDSLPPTQALIETVLDEYLEELAAGLHPDQESYIRKNPELADALRGVFKTLDFVEATSTTLRAGQLGHGSRLGEFRIIREVARGGMGVVYEAVQTPLNRRVALKVLPAAAILSPTAAERFAREAATTGQLHHTNIVPVYAVGEADGVHYYAMQFIEGQSLAGHLKTIKENPQSLDRSYYRRVARWGMQIAEALAHAHSQGIVHRDIKPSNLLLDERDDVWISDFGLARVDSMASLTLSGDIVGTTRYMSPEQARGEGRVDGRSDIYSLGVTLYELLALVPAFDGASRDEVLSRIASTDPPRLRKTNAAIARDLETIVGKCMERELESRYASGEQVANDLRRFLDGAPIRARRTPLIVCAGRYVRKHRVHAAGVALALTLTVATVLLIRQVRRVEGDRLLEQGYAAVLFDRDFERGESLLDDAESRGVDDARLWIYRSLIPLLDNEPNQAIPFLESALRHDPQSVEATLGMGLAYAANGDFFNAQRKLAAVEPDQIKTALGWYLRGLALSKTTRTEAIDAYNRAIEVRTDFTPAIEARAHYRGIRLLTESASDQLDPMLDDLDALVVFRPNDAMAFCARGSGWLIAAAHAKRTPSLHERADQWLANSAVDYDKALDLAPSNLALVLVRQGVHARYTGDFDSAATAFEKAIAADGAAGRTPHPYRIHELATARYALGEFDSGLRLIEPACKSSPGYCPLVLQQALLLAEVGRLSEARSVAAVSIERQAANANGLFLSTVIAELLGERESARHGIEQFAESARLENGSASSDAPPELALAFLNRDIDASTLRASVGDAPGRRCEVMFLIAIRALADGDRSAGRDALFECVDTGVFVFAEYRFAQMMLARMDAQPDWPAWNH
ncbi:MAG TPA: protein kinase [Phycisphaerae bacterium]|nr:protein kinase [Phycisphaerae bacterium]